MISALVAQTAEDTGDFTQNSEKSLNQFWLA